MFWLYILIQIFLIIIVVAGAIQFFKILFLGQAPFIKTNRKIIKAILAEIDLNKKDIFYELGSGNASLLRQLAKKYPKNKLIGVENSLLPWLVSRIQVSLTKSSVIIKKKDFNKLDLSQADYIYCFLNIEAMEKLEKKFHRQCQRGCIIISYIFQLPHSRPYQTIQIKNNQVYFYKM